MHGGASFGLADTAVAASLITIYGPGNALLTIEMKINYLEPIFPGTVTAEAYVLRHEPAQRLRRGRHLVGRQARRARQHDLHDQAARRDAPLTAKHGTPPRHAA